MEMETDERRIEAQFYRAHGLGNDYLVFQASAPGTGDWTLSAQAVRTICRRGTGEGSDGLVVLMDGEPPAGNPFPLRMFNPDGSEFERSGNGLRILASYLRRSGRVGPEPFLVRSGGRPIAMTVHGVEPGGRYDVSVRMGRARPTPAAVDLDPSRLPGGEGSGGAARLLHPRLGPVEFQPVSVGNPHAVVFTDDLSESNLREVGSFLTGHPAFAAGTNVQLARVEGLARLRIAIWERGVGRTPASGTSSCAAAVAAVHQGRIAPGPVEVEMEGGMLQVSVGRDLEVVLRGPVQEVCVGRLTEGFLATL
jgi:diaminopimelate epimerase